MSTSNPRFSTQPPSPRTQNDQEYFSFKKGLASVSNSLVFPLDSNPSDNEIAILEAFLSLHPAKRGSVNLTSFIHFGAYKTYPDMTSGVLSQQTSIIESYLNANEASKLVGDSIYLLSSNVSNHQE